jgi:RNA polymerase sigma factor (sigma-70 family)
MSDITATLGAELFERARAGDQAAWSALYDGIQDKIRRVVRRKLDRRMVSLYDSTDFASAVWQSLIERLDEFEFHSIEALQHYLVMKAESKVIDEYRKQQAQKRGGGKTKRLEGDEEEFGLGAIIPSKDPSPSQVAQGKESWEILSEGVDDDHMEVLEMARDGYTNVEISEKLGWSLRKVQRVLKKLNPSHSE